MFSELHIFQFKNVLYSWKNRIAELEFKTFREGHSLKVCVHWNWKIGHPNFWDQAPQQSPFTFSVVICHHSLLNFFPIFSERQFFRIIKNSWRRLKSLPSVLSSIVLCSFPKNCSSLEYVFHTQMFVILSCFLYFDPGKRSCPSISCYNINYPNSFEVAYNV